MKMCMNVPNKCGRTSSTGDIWTFILFYLFNSTYGIDLISTTPPKLSDRFQ